MARTIAWTRLTPILFFAVVGAMIWWHNSFEQQRKQHEALRETTEQGRVLDSTRTELQRELDDLRKSLDELRSSKQDVSETLAKTMQTMGQLKQLAADSIAKAKVAQESVDQEKAAMAKAETARQEAAAAAEKARAQKIDANVQKSASSSTDGGAIAKAATGENEGPAIAQRVRYQGIPPTAGKFDSEENYDFKDTAIVTLATGNNAARGVIALVQSLRDVGTRAQDIVVMLSRGGSGSPECNDAKWKVARGRQDIRCNGPDAIAEEIISPQYIETLSGRLGAKILVVDEIPSTQYTEGIPGGRSTFWGMALNKLRVFNLTQYKKALWMDGDTFVLKNVDHLFKHPFGTMAFTYACCNPNGPAIPSGGLWVVEPSLEVGVKLWRMMAEGKPKIDKDGNVLLNDREYWHWGDMQLLRWMMSKWDTKPAKEALWPRVDDVRHGGAAGQRYFPQFAGKDEATFRSKALADRWNGSPMWDGFDPSIPAEQILGENMLGEQAPMWRSLDARYDQCVGSCECLPERDMPNDFYSLHFSCLHSASKPQSYPSETALARQLVDNALSCTRYYFWAVWYEAFKRAHGPLPEPYDGVVPLWNATHDEIVKANKKKKQR